MGIHFIVLFLCSVLVGGQDQEFLQTQVSYVVEPFEYEGFLNQSGP